MRRGPSNRRALVISSGIVHPSLLGQLSREKAPGSDLENRLCCSTMRFAACLHRRFILRLIAIRLQTPRTRAEDVEADVGRTDNVRGA